MPSLAALGNQLYTGERSVPFVSRRRIWFVIAGSLVLFSILIVAFRGLTLGIEFQGGSQFTVSGTAAAEEQIAQDVLQDVETEQAPRISIVGEGTVRIQTDELGTETTNAVRA